MNYQTLSHPHIDPYEHYEDIISESIERYYKAEMIEEAHALLANNEGDLCHLIQEINDGDLTKEEAFDKAYEYVLECRVEEFLEYQD